MLTKPLDRTVDGAIFQDDGTILVGPQEREVVTPAPTITDPKTGMQIPFGDPTKSKEPILPRRLPPIAREELNNQVGAPSNPSPQIPYGPMEDMGPAPMLTGLSEGFVDDTVGDMPPSPMIDRVGGGQIPGLPPGITMEQIRRIIEFLSKGAFGPKIGPRIPVQ
jgi:hypothetical protein